MVVPFTKRGKCKEDLVAGQMSLVLNMMNLWHLLIHLVGFARNRTGKKAEIRSKPRKDEGMWQRGS